MGGLGRPIQGATLSCNTAATLDLLTLYGEQTDHSVKPFERRQARSNRPNCAAGGAVTAGRADVLPRDTVLGFRGVQALARAERGRQPAGAHLRGLLQGRRHDRVRGRVRRGAHRLLQVAGPSADHPVTSGPEVQTCVGVPSVPSLGAPLSTVYTVEHCSWQLPRCWITESCDRKVMVSTRHDANAVLCAQTRPSAYISCPCDAVSAR